MSQVTPTSEPRPVVPVLEYGSPAELAPVPVPFGVRLSFFLLSLAAAASPFLPFTFNTSPLDVWIEFFRHVTFRAADELLWIATPFFVGLPLAALGLYRLFGPGLTRRSRIVVIATGFVMAAVTQTFVVRGFVSGGLNPTESVQVMLAPAVFVIGGLLFVGLRRNRRRDDAGAVVLAMGYACNAAMLLVVMYTPTHVGWWATLAAVSGIAGEWAYLCVRVVRAGR